MTPVDDARRLARDKRLRDQYNITADEYDIILAFQKGLCPLCLTNKTRSGKNKGKPKPFNVDHDHKTGETRGLLCVACNRKLTEFFTVEVVERIYSYFTKPPVLQALGERRYGRKGRITNKRPRRPRKTTRKKTAPRPKRS